jgi:hypothetical protein
MQSLPYPHTIEELINEIYQDNLNHFEYHENMGGEECKCTLHQTMETIVRYRGE